jgi:hypothetical protein
MSRILAFCCVFLGLLTSLSCGDKPDVYSISVVNLKASSDESIISFEVHVRAGSVEAVSHVPLGWEVAIDNDVNWRSTIRARTTLGAASLAPDELKRLVFTVRRNEYGGTTFDVSGILSISKTFENRKLAVKMEDFSLAASQ